MLLGEPILDFFSLYPAYFGKFICLKSAYNSLSFDTHIPQIVKHFFDLYIMHDPKNHDQKYFILLIPRFWMV
jgi:hypothetical protein